MPDIQIGVDNTDHIAFFCRTCGEAMKVTMVKTVRMLVNSNTGKMDKCTWIQCTCRVHGGQGHRKFYWTTEDGFYCDDKTSKD